jgi:hypothetical protein
VLTSFAEATRRAGPALPSYLALHHAGFSVLLGITTGTVGSYPTFSPLPNGMSICERGPKLALRRRDGLSPALHETSRRFTCAMPPCCTLPGGLFSVALSVSRRTGRFGAGLKTRHYMAGCSCSPDVIRRVALTLTPRLSGGRVFVTGSCEPTTTVSGLSSRPDRIGTSDHPAHPLQLL